MFQWNDEIILQQFPVIICCWRNLREAGLANFGRSWQKLFLPLWQMLREVIPRAFDVLLGSWAKPAQHHQGLRLHSKCQGKIQRDLQKCGLFCISKWEFGNGNMDVGTSAWKEGALTIRFAAGFNSWHFSAALIYGVYYSSLRDDVSASKPRRCSGSLKRGKGKFFLLGSPIRGINGTDDFTDLFSLWFLGWKTTHRLFLCSSGLWEVECLCL